MKKNAKEDDEHSLQGRDFSKKHSLVCNDELFMKDLMAIVDDTMRIVKNTNE